MKDTTQESLKRLQLLERVGKEVKQNTIGENYEGLRKQFIDAGISSYALNLLIERCQNELGDGLPTVVDTEFFVSKSLTIEDDPFETTKESEKRPEPAKYQPKSQGPENSPRPPANGENLTPTKKIRLDKLSPSVSYLIVGTTIVLLIIILYALTKTDSGTYIQDLPIEEGHWTGDVRKGIPDGYGTLEFKAMDRYNRSIYEGDMRNGKMHGKGRLRWRNGDSFEGTFDDDKMVEGTYIDKKQNIRFTGTFQDDHPYSGTVYDNTLNTVMVTLREGKQK